MHGFFCNLTIVCCEITLSEQLQL